MIGARHKSNIWMIAERLITQLSQLLFFMVAANSLSLTEFGDINLLIALSATVLAIFGFNIDTLMWRFARSEKNLNYTQIFNHYFILKFILSLFSIIIIYIIVLFFNEASFTVVFVLIFLVSRLTFNAFNAIDSYFIFIGRGLYPARYKACIAVVMCLIKCTYLIKIQSTLEGVLIIIIFEYLFNAMVLFKLRPKIIFKNNSYVWSKKFIKDIVKDSWPLVLSSAMMILYLRVDQLMIYKILGSESLGVYSALIRLTEGWYFILFVTANNYYPRLVLLYTTDYARYARAVRSMLLIFFSLVFSFWLTMYYYGEDLISFAFGANFVQGQDTFLILITGGLAVSFGLYSGKWLVTTNLQRYSLFHALTGAIANIILNILLIPEYGITGAAVATVLAQLWSSVVVYFVFKNTRQVFQIFTFVNRYY